MTDPFAIEKGACVFPEILLHMRVSLVEMMTELQQYVGSSPAGVLPVVPLVYQTRAAPPPCWAFSDRTELVFRIIILIESMGEMLQTYCNMSGMKCPSFGRCNFRAKAT